MEDSSDVDINPTKIKKTKRNSVTERKTFEKKRDVESEKIMQNGTGADLENSSQLDTVNEKSKPVKITKISKVKTESKASTNEESPPYESTSSPSADDIFCGFDNVALNKEQIKKQDTLLKILDQLNASCSSVKEPEKQTRQGSEEVEENKPEEAMTVDTGHDTDTDSEQMEIDMGNEKDTSELGSKESQERTKDSDVESVISADEKASKKDNGEEKVAATDNNATESSSTLKTTLKGDGAKVEYCGTCDAEVNDAEEGICCDGDCERWFHLRCSGLSQAEYDELGLDENAKWACSKCSGKPPPQPAADAKPLLTVRKDLGQFTTPSPSIKRRSVNRDGRTPRIDISNPAFLKPFDFGWKRELVYRSTNDSQNRRQGDIYYYTPKGKKLRSLREISDHLVNSDLTVDNFTFWKEPLGIDDPDKEIIRDAKFKLVHKDTNASPAVPKKSLTPKTPKAPKVTPKLTATVTPLDTSGAVKASASVTPRVVLKGKAPPTSGPKFKVTPSKTTAPGQTQKIVISKGDATIQNCHNIEAGIITNNERVAIEPNTMEPAPEEVIEKSTRNKFKRYGLLANAKTPRKRELGLTLSNYRDPSDSSQESSCKTRLAHKSAENRDLKTTKSFKPHDSQHQTVGKSKMAKLSSSEKKKPDQIRKQSKSTVYPPLYQPFPTSQLPFSLGADKSNLQNLYNRRPSPPEIQFRPSNPSSYGCQTSSSLVPRMSGSLTSHQSNTNNRNIFETVLIVDTASSETYLSSPQPSDSPLILNNSDCSIEIVSVESLNSNRNYVAPSASNQLNTTLQGSNIKATINKKNISDFPINNEISSPISLGSSSPEISPLIVIEDDDVEDRLPPSLRRTSPPPSSCLSRSPPSLQLQRIPSPPPLVYAGQVVKSPLPRPNYQEHPRLSSGSQNLNYVEEATNTKKTDTSQFDYRKMKKERFLMRQKARREMVRMKRAYLKEKRLFTRKKYEEKALQVKYLNLKVKNKELKIALLEKGLTHVSPS